MMEKLLQHPTWLKVFSVVLAVLLWAMVMENTNVTETVSFDVQLHVMYNRDYEVYEGPQDLERTVNVRATGKRLVVSRFRAEHFHAVLDYNKITDPGKPTPLDVQLVRLPRQAGAGLEYSVTPATFMVTLMETMEITVPVVIDPAPPAIVQVDGREYTYTLKLAEDQARVKGRADLLKLVRRARLVLDKTDLVPNKTSITKPVVLADATGATVDKVTGPPATVRVEWRELPPGKAFKVQPVTKGTLPNGFVVSRVDAEPVQVIVRAAALGGKLPDKEIVDTQPVDVTGKTQTFVTTVKVLPPAGTTIAADTVNVTVTIEEAQVEKTFKGIPLTVSGKAANAEVTAQVTDVQIRVRGPYSVVNTLDAGGLAAYVDVEGVTAGKHTLPVKVTYPAGLKAVTVDPAVVDVQITTP